ncbi:hypothetical protein FAM09_23480 [Niastella caeni]|uniref:Uncharacterized protein n=1 Tax=Niastella caeni TaxID=2569763 RepID=A0A4S8HMD4_9BACT|nr:hypothetical protein [Niastella caeni]THU34954.1 hypothetical protein FAM09_23480 [Niastella caeni]
MKPKITVLRALPILFCIQLPICLFLTLPCPLLADGNITASGAVISTTTHMSINTVRNNRASKLYVNTALLESNAASLNTFSAPVTGFIGVRFDYTLGNDGPGAFSETILFNSVLSDVDRQAINCNQNLYYSLGLGAAYTGGQRLWGR